MKITVVPAQVTTVEDRIMGSLGFSQMMLLVAPVFVSAMLFAALPPAMGSSPYKYILMATVSAFCALLAIRIKGKIVAQWLGTILKYQLRPKYYLFNKNVTLYREDYSSHKEQMQVTESERARKVRKLKPKLSMYETAKVLAAIEHPGAKLRFETRRGGLHVRLTEVKE